MKPHDYILTDSIVFDSKAHAVPYQYRLSFKISLASLILGLACGKSGCSLTKLHLIMIAMYSEEERNNLLNYANGEATHFLILRYDPTINKTVDFMLAEKIIYQQGNELFRLTKAGKKFLDEIMNDEILLINEKDFLRKLSNKLNEKIIDDLKRRLMG